MIMFGFLLGLLLATCGVLSRCLYKVQEGHVAVLVTFGRAEAREDGRLLTFGPGLHLKRPWQAVRVVSMMEQTLDLGCETGGSTAMADDGTILRLDSFIRYVPLERELHDYLFGLARPLQHITGLFTCLLRNEIANFRGRGEGGGASLTTRFDFARQAGSYSLIRRERKLLNDRIHEFCREKIDERYGVRFNAVDLADILPPDELADALNAVIQAQTEAEGRLFRAEGECQQRLLSAERGVAIARARAQATEVEIERLASYLGSLDEAGVLTDYVARRRREVLGEARVTYVKEVAA